MIHSGKTCANPECFGPIRHGSNLCGSCRDIRDSVIVVGVCFGMCALIIALARIGRML